MGVRIFYNVIRIILIVSAWLIDALNSFIHKMTHERPDFLLWRLKLSIDLMLVLGTILSDLFASRRDAGIQSHGG